MSQRVPCPRCGRPISIRRTCQDNHAKACDGSGKTARQRYEEKRKTMSGINWQESGDEIAELRGDLERCHTELESMTKNRDEIAAVLKLHQDHLHTGPKDGVDGCSCASCTMHRHRRTHFVPLHIADGLSKALEEALAAVWDGHYSGKGVAAAYAQNVDKKAKAAIIDYEKATQ